MVALIGSGASIVVALVALLQATRLSRKTGDAERRKQAFEVALAEARPVEDALQTAWQDLQAIKEIIASALGGREFDRERAARDLRAAIDRLASGYAEHGAQLSPSAQKVWHGAKSTATGTGMLLLRGASLTTDVQKAASELQTAREKLTELQGALVNERENVRGLLTRRMFELL